MTPTRPVGGDDTDALCDLVLARRGRLIARHRRDRGLTQSGLAHLAGCDQSTISGAERGAHDLTIRTAGRLAVALGLTLEAVLVGASHITPTTTEAP